MTALVGAAEAALELKRRYEDNPLLFYKPCCKVHSKWEGKQLTVFCPKIPCPDSLHTRFHMSPKKNRIVFGGNRSAKTYTGVAEGLMMSCLKNHPFKKTLNPVDCKGRIYSSDFAIIEKLFIPLVRKLIPKGALAGEGKTKGEAFENSYDTKYHILHLKEGRTIDFMSYDQEQSKSESVELDWIMGDEEMPENVFNAASSRLISRNGILWLTVTPLYKLTWAMQFLDETDDPNVDVFRWEIYDNPHISKDAIKDFEASITNPLEKEARLHGRFMELQGLVYKELRNDIHLVAPDPTQPKASNPVIFTLDPHPRKPSVMTWSYVTPQGDVVFFDELEMAGTARELVSAIRKKEAAHRAITVLRLIDPAARAQGSNIAYQTDTLREFEREGMSFTLADNSDAGYNVVHEYLGWDNSRPLGSMNRPQCYFTKDVSKTWYGMTHLRWDEWTFKNQQKDDKERVKDYKKDFPDCVRYTLAYRPTYRNLFMPSSVQTGNSIYADQTGQPRDNEVRRMLLAGRAA